MKTKQIYVTSDDQEFRNEYQALEHEIVNALPNLIGQMIADSHNANTHAPMQVSPTLCAALVRSMLSSNGDKVIQKLQYLNELRNKLLMMNWAEDRITLATTAGAGHA